MRNCRIHVGLGGAVLLAALAACSANSGGPSSASETAPASAPPNPPIVSLHISPTSLSEGQSAIATWSSSSAASCKAAGSWSGVAALDNASGLTIGPFTSPGTYTYGMVCTGPGGTTADSKTVIVGAVAAPTIQLDLVPSSVMPGSSALITWTSTNATTCTGSSGTGTDGWQGNQATQAPDGFNTGPIAKAGQYEYDLTCLGPGGSTQATRILTVTAAAAPAPPGLAFSAQPSLVQPGGSITLSWTATNATSCAASGGSGADGWNGKQPLTSTATSVGPIDLGTYSYTLTCSGPGGSAAKSLSIVSSTAPPALALNIAVTPAQITAGSAADLTWSSSNVDACTASGSWSGSEPLQGNSVSTGTLTTAGVYSFTLTCSGVDGSTVDSAALTVAPAPAAIGNFTAAPAAIQTGQSTVLSWTSSGATACSGSGVSTIGGWNGAQATANPNLAVGPFTTAGVYLFTLSCAGPGGSGTPRTAAVTVSNVNNVPPPAAGITSFTASPSVLQTGQSTTLAWSSSSANACTAGGGSGSDAWSGALAANGSLGVGPLGTAGNYVYTLTCSGPGGSSAPGSVSVDVNSTPPAAVIDAFSASPTAIQTGQSATFAWSSSGATACAATGGTGSDHWSGSVATSSAGTSIGPINANGPVTYTLTCTGAGGASAPSSMTIDVTATPPAATIASFTAPGSLQTGQAPILAWSSSNATSCTAGGGTGSDGWNGTEPTSSLGLTLTPITTAGTYVYTLTCSGAGGASSPSSATVVVGNAAPAATIGSFTATPSTVQAGQTIQLAWSTSQASACTATGGTGSDGWSGTVPVSSSGTTVGPINAAGTYAYTLTCTGSGGSSSPSSLDVTVNNAPVAATIVSFTATPNVIPAGQASSLAWSTGNATSCTATGGTGSDGWNGTMASSSSGISTGALTAGTTYTLTCTGPGGTSAPSSVTVTVNPATPVQPTVALLVNGSSTATIQPGSAPTLSWSTSGASACVASGGTGSDGWSGSQAIANNGAALGAISTPGTYSYTLNCTGAGGSGSGTVELTVVSSASYDCGIPGVTTAALVAPAASVTTNITGVLCLLDCSVAHAGNVIDSTPSNYATLIIPLGLAGGVSLDVAAGTSFPAGRQVGFVIANGTSVLDAALIGGVTVQTSLNGTVQEIASAGNLLSLQAAGLLAVDQYAGFVGFTTTKPFDSIDIVAGSLATLASTVKVYSACVSQ